MPAPGDQHSTITNPFEETRPRVSEYTAQEIATLQSRLEKQLGPEYLSARTGPSGQKVHYIAAEKCIALANEVFGFNGWSSSIKEIQVDFVDENPQTLKISLGLSVIVRVSLRDGTFHEDIGYGHIENCKGKAAAFEKAKKEGTTDALKRALRNFGNVLGNCIYDKAYLQKVTKLKFEPSKFHESELHRHADYVKKEAEVKAEEAHNTAVTDLSATDSFEDLMGEFDEVDFNVIDEGHPDEVVLPSNVQPQAHQPNGRPAIQPPPRPLARSRSAGNPSRQPQTPIQASARPGPQINHNSYNRPPQPLQNQIRPNGAQPGGHVPAQNSSSGSSNFPQQQAQGPHHQGQNGPANGGAPEAVGFFSARAVKQMAGSMGDEEAKLPTAPLAGQVFNPHTESPSIRRTPGIDHTTSKPLARTGQHVAPVERTDSVSGSGSSGPRGNGHMGGGPPTVNSMGGGGGARASLGGQASSHVNNRANMVNPQLNQARRIGAPGGPGSPLANRGQYKPPTIKRPLPADGGGPPGRPALAEVTANGTVHPIAGAAATGDAKRQKMG